MDGLVHWVVMILGIEKQLGEELDSKKGRTRVVAGVNIPPSP